MRPWGKTHPAPHPPMGSGGVGWHGLTPPSNSSKVHDDHLTVLHEFPTRDVIGREEHQTRCQQLNSHRAQSRPDGNMDGMGEWAVNPRVMSPCQNFLLHRRRQLEPFPLPSFVHHPSSSRISIQPRTSRTFVLLFAPAPKFPLSGAPSRLPNRLPSAQKASLFLWHARPSRRPPRRPPRCFDHLGPHSDNV